MDLKNFKMMKDDATAYTLAHPSGKTITVPKKGLKPEAHEMIKKMCSGGTVQKMAEGGPASSMQTMQPSATAPMQKFAGDESDPSASEVQSDDQAPADDSMPTTQGPTVAMNTDTAPTTVGPKGFADLPGSKFFSNLWENRPGNHTVFNRPEDVAARDAKVKADEAAANPTQEAPQDVPAPLVPVTPQAVMPGKASKDVTMAQAYQNEKNANTAYASAIGQEGTAEQKAIDANQQQIAKMPTQQDIVDANRQKNQDLMDAYNSKTLDPNRYMHNLSTTGKVTTALALFLGGMSTPFTHQGNPALTMMTNAINNDIDAQKNDQQKAHTLYSMNRDALGTDMAANLATQNQMYTGLKYKLQSAASQFKGPMAQANAKMLNSQIDQKIAMNNQMLGLHAGLSGQAGDGTEQSFAQNLQNAQVYAPEMAKDAQGKYLPGVGIARVPVTEDDRKELTAYDSISKMATKAQALQDAYGKGGAWSVQNRADAASIQAQLRVSLGDLTGIKRLSPEVMKNYDTIVGQIGSMNLGGVSDKLKDLQQFAQSKKASVLGGLGVTPFKKSAQDQVAIKWAQQNIRSSDPNLAQKAQTILNLHGGK